MISTTNIFLLTILLTLSICAQCYIVAPGGTRIGSFTRRNTQLRSTLHELAEKGDIGGVMDIISKDPRLVNKFDIDGKKKKC